MAIVKEYVTPSGVTIKINDECYRDKTPEEIQKALDHISETASRLLYEQALRHAREKAAG